MWKLGKLPAVDASSETLRLAKYMDQSALPDVPKRFGNSVVFDTFDWGVLGNNDVSNCVEAGFAHQIRLWRKSAYNQTVDFTDTSVIRAYSLMTGYDPSNAKTDAGTELLSASQYWQQTGIVDADGNLHQIAGYATVNTSPDIIACATYLFGACGIGIQMPATGMDQFTAAQPWDVASANSANLGGHYVPLVGRNSAGNFLCITWGRLQAITPAFIDAYCDEAVVHFSSIDWLKNQITPHGFDLTNLETDLALLKAA